MGGGEDRKGETRRLIAGPFNRVEGDLEVQLTIEDDRVSAAHVNSPLFRGFEAILAGKDPRDALTIVPRICGICSVSQSMAAQRALAELQGIAPPPNGLLAQAVVHAAENLADHLLHFHVFFMADFARQIYAPRPWFEEVHELFAAKIGTAVRAAIEARATLFHVMGVLAGKWPHTLSLQPGGVTKAPDARDRMRLLATVRQFRAFCEKQLFGAPLEEVAALETADALQAFAETGAPAFAKTYLHIANDLDLRVAGLGPPRLMSFGGYKLAHETVFAPGLLRDGREEEIDFSSIAEDLSHSWMLGEAAHPARGETVPDPQMREPGYSWCKAPRLAGETVEVGAIARQANDGHPLALAMLREGRANVHARIVGRLLEIARLVPVMEEWVRAMDVGEPFIMHPKRIEDGSARGLTEAARGSLGHWVTVEKGRIAHYQIVAPTTWNFSPRDATGTPGPLEAALEGAPVLPGETTPVSVQHIVRSFDPCMVCTVH